MENKFSKFSVSELELLQRALGSHASRAHDDAIVFHRRAERSFGDTRRSWQSMASAREDEHCESQHAFVEVQQELDRRAEHEAA